MKRTEQNTELLRTENADDERCADDEHGTRGQLNFPYPIFMLSFTILVGESSALYAIRVIANAAREKLISYWSDGRSVGMFSTSLCLWTRTADCLSATKATFDHCDHYNNNERL